MPVLLQISLILVAALALCSYVGWGLARLALPQALMPYQPLLVPLIGYATTVWLGYLAVHSFFNLRTALPLVLLLATLLNILAWRRTGRPQFGWLRQEIWVLVVVLFALLVGIAPLLDYGYLTTIGRGWDPESYLPMAQHLVDYRIVDIPNAPTNPLRGLVSDPPRIGLTLGFSVLHGFSMLLSGQTALASFATLLALLRAFGVLALYIWLRSCMGLERPAATIAAACAALGSLMLWIAFFNFGMQIASWPLIGLGLAMGLTAIDELATRGRTAWPAMLLAAITLAAIPVTYYPALTVFVPMAAGLGLARFVEGLGEYGHDPIGRHIWRPYMRYGHQLFLYGRHIWRPYIALGLTTLLFAWPTIGDYYAGFAFRYSLVAQKIGPDRFIPITDTLGLTPFRLEGGGGQPPTLLVWAALIALLPLCLGLLLRTAEPQPYNYRLRWVLVLLPIIGYLGWLQYIRPYEYAFMKTSAYVGAPLWGLLLLGWQRLAARGRLAAQDIAPLARPLLLLLPLSALLYSQFLIVKEHAANPTLFGRDLVSLEFAAARVPVESTILISADERFVGPNNGLFSAILYPRTIWGRVATAYYGLSYWPAGGTPNYALLAAQEPPWPLEFGASEIWRSRAAALYQFDPAMQWLSGRGRIHIDEAASDPFSPAAMAIWRRAGPLVTATPESPLQLDINQSIRICGACENPASIAIPGLRALTLTLAAAEPRNITLRSGSNATELTIPAGVSQVSLSVMAPSILEIAADGMVAVADARIQPSTELIPAQANLLTNQIVWHAQAEQNGELISVTLQQYGPAHTLRAEITVVEDTFDSPRQLARTLAALPNNQEWQLRYAPARSAIEARIAGEPTPLLQADILPNAPDGSYFAVLALYSGEEVIARAPLYRVQISANQITGFEAIAYTLEAAIPGARTQLPTNQHALLQAPVALDEQPRQINQIILARQPAQPGSLFEAPFSAGESLSAQVYWQANAADPRALAISVQVIGPDDRKIAQWDGPAGGDWRPASQWAVGEYVRLDVPLTLDTAAPAGTYRVLIAAYDPATGTPQTIAGQQVVVVGEVQVIGNQ